MDLNKAMIIGNVTRDPEVRNTPSGQAVVSFGVATNLVWKDQAGNKQEKVEFHNIVAWRKLAETIGKYVKKGSKLYVEGRLQTRTWDDKNGVKRYTTEIVADNIIMLDRAGARPASGEGNQPSPADNYSQAAPAAAAIEEEINVEDIPF
jgi:single-strand DNA-binding protein